MGSIIHEITIIKLNGFEVRVDELSEIVGKEKVFIFL